MKRNWLLCLVIFSLALNLGTIGAFAYLRYQDRRDAALRPGPAPPMHLRELWGRLNLDPEQRRDLDHLFPEHRRRVWEQRGLLAQKRQELFELIRGEEPAWPVVCGKVREISELQGKLEEEVLRFLLDVRKRLKPEQRAAFAGLVERRLMPVLGGMGGPCGPGRRGPGRGPGPDCPMPELPGPK